MTPTKRWSMLIVAMVQLFLMGIGVAQNNPAPTSSSFEVLSVKQNRTGEGGSIGLRADGIYAENVPLRFLVGAAFNHEFANDRMANMPSWADTDRFDITGKVTEVYLPKLQNLTREQFVSMREQLVQAFLTDRFQFKFHTEVREGPVYELVIAKGGPKFKPAPPNPPQKFNLTAISGKIEGHGVSMVGLVRALQNTGQLDRVVIDRTGLVGNYDFALNWIPDSPSAPADSGLSESDMPGLFTAIAEQMGLKLAPAKGPVSTLIVDHVEKPSEN